MGYLVVIIVLIGCTASPDIDGTFVGAFEHEFGKTTDTLVLRKANGLYEIERRTGLQRKLEGRIFPKELKIENWILQYNEGKKVLFELKKGKILLLNEGGLKLGNRQYKRL